MNNSCDKLFKTLQNVDSQIGDLRLNNAKYNEQTNVVTVNAVSDIALSEESKQFVKKSLEKALDNKINVDFNVCKSICDKDIAKNAIKNYVTTYAFAVSHLLVGEYIRIVSVNKTVVAELDVPTEVYDFFGRINFVEEMVNRLQREYSNDFSISLREVAVKQVETPKYDIQSVSVNELEESTERYVKVNYATKFIDDEEYDTAIYIEDGINKIGQVYFAGTVVEKEEKTSKNGNVYYVITIDDKTEKVSGRFFTRDKNKLKKLDKIDVGSVIIIRGENEVYNGSISLTVKGINLCEFPLGYVPKEKPSKKAPSKYTYVFPQKAETLKQDDFFTVEANYPSDFLEKTFTVVDVETTGTNPLEDKVTEIGAVRIENGKITEHFQTLINPQIPIPERIVELTGIDDELVKNEKIMQDVYPDFFKFIGDTVFVGHNAEFDFRFLKKAGKDNGYIMNNEVVDTLYLSRKILPFLSQHKLNKVCEYYGITFRHHRALSDAYATAELLLELLKDKKSLKDI